MPSKATASKLTGASTLLTGALCLGALVSLALATGDNQDERFYRFMRTRVGYFSRYNQSSPYARIYEDYFEHVIKKNDRAMQSLPSDDWRRLRPTGELCVDFLVGLTVKSLVMSKPYEVIILDACLDWLLDTTDDLRSEERANDIARLDSSRRASLDTLRSHSKLRQIYESTRFKDERQVPEKLKEDIHSYVARLLQIYSANPRNGCHSLWLEAYNNFIDDVYVGDCKDDTDCQFFGVPNIASDSYLSMILESTRQASKTCYNVMQNQIHGLMLSEFEQANSGASKLKLGFMSKTNPVVQQMESKKWAREMISILQMVAGVSQDTPVDLGSVVKNLHEIKRGNNDLIERFTKAIGDYATSRAELKDSSNDQYGRARFGRAMAKLCRPYIDKPNFLSMTGGINTDGDESERQPFEFYNLIYSLVRLTNHESIFDISKDLFEEHVIKNHWEALYLATFACQIISTTWGELDYEQNTQAFNVRLRPEWQLMVADWPLEVLAERLPTKYSKSGATSSAAAPSKPSGEPTAARQPAFFGKKFRLKFTHKSRQEAVEAEPPATSSPPEQRPLPASNDPPSSSPPRVLAPPPIRQPAPEKDRKIMSLETIEMYRKLHGRYPRLPDYYREIYPQLPADLGGHYPKELGLSKGDTQTSPNSLFGGRFANPLERQKSSSSKMDKISALSSLKF